MSQEGLTDIARHAHARRAEISLCRTPSGVELRVRDDGRGIGVASEGAGMLGMRERALLVGADLDVGPAAGGGALVRRAVPAPGRGPVPVRTPPSLTALPDRKTRT
ncbi:sensor histidine kinase [Streptomyces sp. NEAU-W12]|uniref:sensor histidine kinase n=1 Tax=Streptomyces sp. NEAU-W12 TaxID=2994668 RepID=UPI003A4C6C98